MCAGSLRASMLRACWIVAAVAVTVTAPAPAASPAGPTLGQVIKRVGAYLDDYGARLATVIGVEHYEQTWTTPADATSHERHLVSEIALVRVKDDWLGYRDVFEVDGRRIADRGDRLRQLFTETPERVIEQGRRLADESARYNAGPVQRNFNVPTITLFFMQTANQDRFRFARDGEEELDGVAVWRIRFQETRRPTLIRMTDGRNAPVKGRLWADPVDGRVFRTEMEVDAGIVFTEMVPLGRRDAEPGRRGAVIPLELRRVPSRATISVLYRMDERLRLLMPAEMRELYVGPWTDRLASASASTITCRATYSDFRRFETSVRIVIPK